MKPETYIKVSSIVWTIAMWSCAVGAAACIAGLILHYITGMPLGTEYLGKKIGGVAWTWVYGVIFSALHLLSKWALKRVKETDDG
jgi:hypothetical protein